MPLVRRDGAFWLQSPQGPWLRTNASSFAIWECLDYPVTADRIAWRLASEFEVDIAAAVSAVGICLEEFSRLDLIRPVDAQDVNPARDSYFRLLKQNIAGLHEVADTLRLEHLVNRTAGIDRELREYLCNIRYLQPDEFQSSRDRRRVGTFRPQAFTDHLGDGSYSPSMAGLQRLENIERLAEIVFREDIPGDFLEAGTCRGGCGMLMRALQVQFGQAHRRVWLADSFDGLPVSSAGPDVDSRLDMSRDVYPELAAGVDLVLDNFRDYDLLDENVIMLEGLFADTLPEVDTGPLAILRLDADLYGSTMDVLENLYDKVVPGGFVIIDDYAALAVCARAVDEFRARRGISAPLRQIDQHAVWWRTTA
ncbi:MAG: TylF/MycF/NovP-related O-methyltransferase [Pseudomonadota bacterium]|nr:TylF/MycF/NovP-related O-methyltransferase [Pseudomonadota bacterium]